MKNKPWSLTIDLKRPWCLTTMSIIIPVGQLHSLWSLLARNRSSLWVGLLWHKWRHNYLLSNPWKVENPLQNSSISFFNRKFNLTKINGHYKACIWRFSRLSKCYIFGRKLLHPCKALSNNIFWLSACRFYEYQNGLLIDDCEDD